MALAELSRGKRSVGATNSDLTSGRRPGTERNH